MIRNELYTKYSCEISSLAAKLNDVLDCSPSSDGTMEEKEIRHVIYKTAEALSDAEHIINYFKKDTKEGKLVKLSNGRFEINYKHGGCSYQLTCGSPLEVYLKNDRPDVEREEGWYSGRVEATDGNYYFYGPGNPKLFVGMKVRIRE